MRKLRPPLAVLIVATFLAVVLVVAGLLSSFVISVPLVKADTPVGGFITEDTTWTEEGSPYIVIQGVIVVQGVTLTIEPGVLVKFEVDKALQIDGQLIARGTEAKGITFTSSQPFPAREDWCCIIFTDTSTDAVFDEEGNYVSGCILQYCTVEYAGAGYPALRMLHSGPFIDHCTITSNGHAGIDADHGSLKITNNVITDNSRDGIHTSSGTVTITDNTITGNGDDGIETDYGTVAITDNAISGNGDRGIHTSGATVTITDNTITGNSDGGIYTDMGTATISGNTITGNSAYSGGGIRTWGGTATIRGNTITGNSASYDGGGISTYSGTVRIRGNAITDNSASSDGGGIYISYGTVTIMYNDIVGNRVEDGGKGGGILVGGTVTINCNNLYDNIPYDVANANAYGTPNVDATNNWWGTTDVDAIEERIWDWFDDCNYGIVDFIPYLLAEYVRADADGDGDVDVFDLVKVKRIILGLDDPTCGADANQDGVVDVFDLVKVKRIILGIDP